MLVCFKPAHNDPGTTSSIPLAFATAPTAARVNRRLDELRAVVSACQQQFDEHAGRTALPLLASRAGYCRVEFAAATALAHVADAYYQFRGVSNSPDAAPAPLRAPATPTIREVPVGDMTVLRMIASFVAEHWQSLTRDFGQVQLHATICRHRCCPGRASPGIASRPFQQPDLSAAPTPQPWASPQVRRAPCWCHPVPEPKRINEAEASPRRSHERREHREHRSAAVTGPPSIWASRTLEPRLLVDVTRSTRRLLQTQLKRQQAEATPRRDLASRSAVTWLALHEGRHVGGTEAALCIDTLAGRHTCGTVQEWTCCCHVRNQRARVLRSQCNARGRCSVRLLEFSSDSHAADVVLPHSGEQRAHHVGVPTQHNT